MKVMTVTVKAKDGTDKVGDMMMPDSLDDLIILATEKFVYNAALRAYVKRSKTRIASGARPRKKILKVDLDSLTPQARSALISVGLMHED